MVYKMATVGRCMDQPSGGDSLLDDGDEEATANKGNNNMTSSQHKQLVVADACKKKNGVALNCFPDEKSSSSSHYAAAATTTAHGEGGMRNKMKMMMKKKVALVNSKKPRINGSAVDNSSVSAKGLLFSQPSIPNLRSRKDKQQQPQPQQHQTRRPVPDSSARKRRRSSRHEKAEQQHQTTTATTTTTTTKNESVSCCCQEKKTQGEIPHENNNASPCISQTNNKGSLELSSPSPIYRLPSIRDGLALNNERTKTAAGQAGGPGSTGHTGAQPPVPPRPCTPIMPCSAASASSVVNCTLNSSPSKDSQNFDYNCNKETATHCKWKNCDIVVLDPDLLMAHIREKHVESQEGSEAYVCFWDGCKVYAKRSCSMSWLERHILSHSGDKPFKCIVDGCDMRFPSHHGLERHVNSHFNTQQPTAPKPPKLREDTPTKLWKKKKMKRKRPQLVRTGDFFDSGIMERLQQELVTLTRITQIDLEGSTDSITFHGTVIARRTEESGKVKVLLHWTPENIFPDCWVPESQVQEMYKRVIPLTSLPQDTAATLHSSFYRRHRYRKHRRK